MSKVIKLKKGLHIQIKGEPANNLEHIGMPESFLIAVACYIFPRNSLRNKK